MISTTAAGSRGGQFAARFFRARMEGVLIGLLGGYEMRKESKRAPTAWGDAEEVSAVSIQAAGIVTAQNPPPANCRRDEI